MHALYAQGKPTKKHIDPISLMMESIPTPQQTTRPVPPAVSEGSSSEKKQPPRKLAKDQRSVSSTVLGSAAASTTFPRSHLEINRSGTLPRVSEESKCTGESDVPKKRSNSTTNRPFGTGKKKS